MSKKIISIISMGVLLNWLSIFFSYKKLDNLDINQPIATGGFPLKIFSYPVPPMGHDWPPVEVWPIFFLNLIIWIIVASIISFILGKRFEYRRSMASSVVSAIFMSIFGLFYLMLKFD